MSDDSTASKKRKMDSEEKEETANPKRTNLLNFDNADQNMYDVELKVEEESFFVMKGFLARHSKYFQKLFFEDFNEKHLKVIPLIDVDPAEFQLLLECINGCLCINDETVEPISRLADMWDVPIALARCEEFLMNEPKENMKRGFQLGVLYKMENLKAKLIADIDTKEELASIAPIQEASSFDAKTLFPLYRKAMYLLVGDEAPMDLAPPTPDLLIDELLDPVNRRQNMEDLIVDAIRLVGPLENGPLNVQIRNAGGIAILEALVQQHHQVHQQQYQQQQVQLQFQQLQQIQQLQQLNLQPVRIEQPYEPNGAFEALRNQILQQMNAQLNQQQNLL